MSEPLSPRLFQCPGEPQPINRAVHLARLERCYPKCRQCEHCEELGQVSERRIRGIRIILSESEPTPTDRFAIKGVESVLSDTARFERWAARFGLWLRGKGDWLLLEERQKVPVPFSSSLSESKEGIRKEKEDGTGNRDTGNRGTGKRDRHLLCQKEPVPISYRNPHVVLADATSRTVPDFVAAVSAGLRWAGCDVTDLGRGAVGMIHFAQKRLDADAGLLLAQPGVWDHECGLSVEGFSTEVKLPELLEGQNSDAPRLPTDRPTRRLGRLERTSMTELYLKSFADRYHALRPLRITLYTSCTPVADALRRLTGPFDVQLEVLPFSVSLRADDAVDIMGAHFSVYIDGTGRMVELLDEQAVPIANVDDLSPDAVEAITAVQILLSRTETPLSELTFRGAGHDKRSRF